MSKSITNVNNNTFLNSINNNVNNAVIPNLINNLIIKISNVPNVLNDERTSHILYLILNDKLDYNHLEKKLNDDTFLANNSNIIRKLKFRKDNNVAILTIDHQNSTNKIKDYLKEFNIY